VEEGAGVAAKLVAIFGYHSIMEIGIRELKDNLSRYIRRVEDGERVRVTAHGRVVAELVRPGAGLRDGKNQLENLIASGLITPALEASDPLEDCVNIGLPPGTGAALIDTDRDEG
jgi:antitoxin (DNA-binding transcriptional repressor) of toxin-antitoxin stability system